MKLIHHCAAGAVLLGLLMLYVWYAAAPPPPSREPIPTVVQANGVETPAPVLTQEQSRQMLTQALAGPAGPPPTVLDMDAMHRLHGLFYDTRGFWSPEEYLRGAGVESTPRLLAAVQAVIAQYEPLVEAEKVEMAKLLHGVAVAKAERGEFLERQTPPAPYNGSWRRTVRPAHWDRPVSVQVFPGEDPAVDEQDAAIRALLDSAYWEISERIKDQ